MRSWPGIVIATLIGIFAAAAPILISLRLAWREGQANENALILSYASDVSRRALEMRQQMFEGTALIQAAHFPPCSPSDIDLMRRIDISSSLIQAVGRLKGNRILCTSLGTKEPIDIGPPDLTTSTGALERIHVSIPMAGNHQLLVVSKGDIAFFLEPSLAIDTPTEGPEISIAIFVPSIASHPILRGNNNIDPDWIRTIPAGTTATFRSVGHVIAIVRAANSDIAVIAAAPESSIAGHIKRFVLIFVPIGLTCAVLLALAVAHISRTRLSLSSALRTAARRKEFFLEYQPIVQLDSRRVIGAEALVRWRRNRTGIVPVERFIPIAEQTGIITEITACVAEMVAADLPGLVEIDDEFFVAINLSAPDLRTPKTLDVFRSILSAENVQPRNISAEATERGFLECAETREILDALRTLGIAVAIDDFGTGYSSLSSLQSLGLDILKIDKTFVDTIGTDGATSGVVPHIIEMAHTLQLHITAEGVETEGQAAFLQEHGVQHAQGWLFSKPICVADLREKLKAQQAHILEIFA